MLLSNADWQAVGISLQLAGLSTVVMVMFLGQTRVLFAMSRDGLPMLRVGFRCAPILFRSLPELRDAFRRPAMTRDGLPVPSGALRRLPMTFHQRNPSCE